MKLSLARVFLSLATISAATTAALAQLPPTTVAVNYDPGLTRVEGDQPLETTVFVQITSPSNLPAGIETVITPILSVIGKPAGTSDADA